MSISEDLLKKEDLRSKSFWGGLADPDPGSISGRADLLRSRQRSRVARKLFTMEREVRRCSPQTSAARSERARRLFGHARRSVEAFCD